MDSKNEKIQELLKIILSQESFQLVANSTKHLKKIPCGQGRIAYCSYPSFQKVINNHLEKIFIILSKFLRQYNVKGNIERRVQEEQFEMILDFNDLTLEKVDSNIDNISGRCKKSTDSFEKKNEVAFQSGSWNKNITNKASWKRYNASSNIKKPQLHFENDVDNSSSPFKPKLSVKHNAIKELQLVPELDSTGIVIGFVHPYYYELSIFEPSSDQLTRCIPEEPKNIDNTNFLIIDKPENLPALLDDLKSVTEIAVDVEHHSQRSYLGLTCLLQISTTNCDYLIDTLTLRGKLMCLNEFFTNPKMLKVFHGADSDIEWLQRDLGIYVVNMFDTYQAAKALGLERLSLRYLLKFYCNVEADKKYQLADWRIRPLPAELVHYARQDTHYLLYISKVLQNEILSKVNGPNLLKLVYNKSTEVCKKVYNKPIPTEGMLMDIYKRSKRSFDNRQMYALKEIFLWRDKVARIEDESCDYILPNHMLLQIAESLPREMQGILACCNPIPHSIRQNLNALHKIILKAREQPLVKEFNTESSRNIVPNKNTVSKLNYSYDMNFEPDEIKEVFIPQNLQYLAKLEKKMKPTLNVFENNLSKEQIQRKDIQFVSPYKRYGAMMKKMKTMEEEVVVKPKSLCPDKIIEEEVDEKPETFVNLKRKSNIHNNDQNKVPKIEIKNYKNQNERNLNDDDIHINKNVTDDDDKFSNINYGKFMGGSKKEEDKTKRKTEKKSNKFIQKMNKMGSLNSKFTKRH